MKTAYRNNRNLGIVRAKPRDNDDDDDDDDDDRNANKTFALSQSCTIFAPRAVYNPFGSLTMMKSDGNTINTEKIMPLSPNSIRFVVKQETLNQKPLPTSKRSQDIPEQPCESGLLITTTFWEIKNQNWSPNGSPDHRRSKDLLRFLIF